MKRVVFISVTLALLLLAEGVTQFALRETSAARPKAPTPAIGAGSLVAQAASAVKVHDVNFYYRMDADARFLDLKNNWQSAHQGEITPEQAGVFARQAYDQSSVEQVFSKWLFHGGPAPQVFSAKVHLYNASTDALLNVPLKVTLKAKVGELRVNPAVQITDYNHLASTAKWETVETRTVTVPAIASGEDMLVPVAKFQMYDFLKIHPNSWPAQVQVEVTSPRIGQTFRKTLDVVPDHFVVPMVY